MLSTFYSVIDCLRRVVVYCIRVVQDCITVVGHPQQIRIQFIEEAPMSNRKKTGKMLTNEGDEDLPHEWEAHSHRLNFIQETMLKMQRKVQKIQKSLLQSFEDTQEMKTEFKEKLNEMVCIISQPQSVDTSAIDSLRLEIEGLKIGQSENSFRITEVQREVTELVERGNSQMNSVHNQEYIKNQIYMSEQKSKQSFDQKLRIVSQQIHQLEKNCESLRSQNIQICKKINSGAANNNSSPPHSTVLNNSAFSGRNSASSRFSSSKSHSRLGEQSDSQREFKRVHHHENSSGNLQNKTNEYGASQNENFLGGNFSRHSAKTKSYQQQNDSACNNSSRVVYLRQKLKEFEEINRNYERKEHENKRINLEPSYSQTASKASQRLLSGQMGSENNEEDRKYLTKKREHQTELKPVCLPNQSLPPSSQSRPHYSSSSSKSGKGNASGKKIDKLRHIKDYLEESESELDDSNILEPSYKF